MKNGNPKLDPGYRFQNIFVLWQFTTVTIVSLSTQNCQTLGNLITYFLIFFSLFHLFHAMSYDFFPNPITNWKCEKNENNLDARKKPNCIPRILRFFTSSSFTYMLLLLFVFVFAIVYNSFFMCMFDAWRRVVKNYLECNPYIKFYHFSLSTYNIFSYIQLLI